MTDERIDVHFSAAAALAVDDMNDGNALPEGVKLK